ncbi:bsl3716 [Bradyrhizobium diazoefficiens USDA 110]|uniref:Bsl3716 protein n=1 Tax=Bradyrhizobium diazoefficiens (strain JCM 10833 / BCRC 13528 / IAM 13628 / NBRC 14792 / USDA 110) TaxID=224911 RepID=Q89NW7_BRADU|nr:hypothetical protein CO678_18370 [Bradyrhizobium diazoefficiens]QBP27133.1 hypothetical protein Bdiaspc4_19175 [Bradyrhizobium diazoefficiens]BAC48981.1 bsl3716 [Bradyrhizobium diazoefficiens USDA 110]
MKCPGAPKTSGCAFIDVSNARCHMTLRGKFEEPAGEDQGWSQQGTAEEERGAASQPLRAKAVG